MCELREKRRQVAALQKAVAERLLADGAAQEH